MKKLKVYLISAFTLIFSIAGFAEEVQLRISEGQIVIGDLQKTEGATQTIVVLNGINRGLEAKSEKAFFLAAKNAKVNLLTLATSSHPRAIAALEKNEFPLFRKKRMTLADYAEEVNLFIKHLKLKNVFVVSLSYSSAVLANLDPNLFAGYIEMVPMADPLESANDVTRSVRDFQESVRLNPFGGEAWVRFQRDAAYSANWRESVQSRLKSDPDFYGENPRVEDIIEGYVSLARAAEDYRLLKTETAFPRHFILVSEELDRRLNSQIEALKQVSVQQNGNMGFLMVANSGHVLPSDQPESAIYAIKMTMDMVNTGKYLAGTVVGETFTPYNGEERQQIGIESISTP